MRNNYTMRDKAISIEDLILQPDTQMLKVLEEARILSKGAPKEYYILEYDPNAKKIIISMLKKMGCIIEKQIDCLNCILVALSSFQLKAIKRSEYLKCVEPNYVYDKIIESKICNDHFIDKITTLTETNRNDSINIVVFGRCEIDNTHILRDTIAYNEKVVDIHFINIEDIQQNVTTVEILASLEWSIKNKTDVIVLSFESEYRSYFLERMINNVFNCGITLISVTGEKQSKNTDFYPASFSNVITL